MMYKVRSWKRHSFQYVHDYSARSKRIQPKNIRMCVYTYIYYRYYIILTCIEIQSDITLARVPTIDGDHQPPIHRASLPEIDPRFTASPIKIEDKGLSQLMVWKNHKKCPFRSIQYIENYLEKGDGVTKKISHNYPMIIPRKFPSVWFNPLISP